jgi:hypothetical protein
MFVILSDERSEESKEPYGRQQSQPGCCAGRRHCDFLQV